MEKKYYLRLYDQKFEVSKEEYCEYYKEKERFGYLKKLDQKHGLVYYQALDNDEYLGEGILSDNSENIEDLITKKIMIEELKICLELLQENEREIIVELFFKGKTERALSAETGIPQKTINNRKKQILIKLKKFLEK